MWRVLAQPTAQAWAGDGASGEDGEAPEAPSRPSEPCRFWRVDPTVFIRLVLAAANSALPCSISAGW